MCLSRKKYSDRMKSLDHVKILAKAFSNIENKSVGVYQYGDYYGFECKKITNYVCFTVKIGEVWQWQQ